MKEEYRAKNRGYNSNETVLIQPTGILDDPRCVTNTTLLCEHIKDKIDDVNRYLDAGERVKQIVVGGDPNIAVELDRITPGNVTACALTDCYKKYLDDTGEEIDNANDIKPVRKTEKTVADALNEMDWLNDTDDFDLSNMEDRQRVNRCVVKHLPAMRYRRAKEKSEARRIERIINDWFDKIPTADHVIVGYDGQTRKDWVISQLHRNKSRYIKYPTKEDGLKLAFSAETRNYEYVDWDMARLFVPDYFENMEYSELSITQRRHASLWLTPHERNLHQFPSTYEDQHPTAEENFAEQTKGAVNASSTVTKI